MKPFPHHRLAPASALAALDAAPFAMFVCDSDGLFETVNQAYEELTGYAAAELVGERTFASLHDHTELTRRRTEGLWPLAVPALDVQGADDQRMRKVHEGEWQYQRRDRSNVPVLVALSAFVDPETPGIHYVGTIVDMSARRADASLQWHGLRHDALTRLPNHTLLEERIDLGIQRCIASGGRFSVLILELDNLRALRDSLGPTAAEFVLRVTADRLREGKDTGDALAFVGGAQFVLVMNEINVPPDIAAKQLLARISQPVECFGTKLTLSASIGMCTYPGDGRDSQTLTRHASIALGVAARVNGGSIRRYAEGMRSGAARRLELETMLRDALEHRQLSLAFQPQVNLASGEIPLVEALVRWHHPSRGTISPVEFIPIAEESGLIVPLGEWVMRTACRQAAHLLRRHGSSPQVAVNVSPVQFERQDLLATVQRALDDTGLAPQYLELEITEGLLLENNEQSLDTLRKLRDMGIEVAIDDFGTGYSSLSYLTRFKFDRLKIDRSFVVAMAHDQGSAAIVSAIIAMAHALGIRVTAEGVETEEQMERLRALQCDEVQGYWFSRPLTPRALETALAPLGRAAPYRSQPTA